jgi:hypothetical protein
LLRSGSKPGTVTILIASWHIPRMILSSPHLLWPASEESLPVACAVARRYKSTSRQPSAGSRLCISSCAPWPIPKDAHVASPVSFLGNHGVADLEQRAIALFPLRGPRAVSRPAHVYCLLWRPRPDLSSVREVLRRDSRAAITS